MKQVTFEDDELHSNAASDPENPDEDKPEGNVPVKRSVATFDLENPDEDKPAGFVLVKRSVKSCDPNKRQQEVVKEQMMENPVIRTYLEEDSNVILNFGVGGKEKRYLSELLAMETPGVDKNKPLQSHIRMKGVSKGYPMVNIQSN